LNAMKRARLLLLESFVTGYYGEGKTGVTLCEVRLS